MKKITKNLCILTALAMLAACNKDADPGATAPAAKTNFAITLPGSVETYAVEDPQAAGQIMPYYNDVTAYFVDAGGYITKIYVWGNEEIRAREIRLEQIVEPASVIVLINTGASTVPTGVSTLAELLEAMKAFLIFDQNHPVYTVASTDEKGNEAGDYLPVQQVTLCGEQSVFTTETSDDGHTLKKAAVELGSLVSRFEVGSVKPGTGLDALTVEAVYVNNFHNTLGGTSTTAFTESSWPSTYSPSWATDAYNAAVTSTTGTKVYAYHVFSGYLIPHIIYKVSGTVSAGYKLADGTGDADNPTPFSGKFITVTGFKENGVSLVSIQPHKIYKMGLENGGVEITPDKITDKPEKTKIDLMVAITVADWTVSNVTPEI